MATTLQAPTPPCIPPRPNADDEFWSLFNPWQFLKARPAPDGERPAWEAVKNYPVAKRLVEHGWIVAARPSSKTAYIVIDIDSESRYHPNHQPYAIQAILQCFESELGLCAPILIRSSDSGGIHIWYWFSEAQNTYQLADAAKTVLQHKGFVIQPGQLELFPNCKTWVDSKDSQDWCLYNALRLPFQEPGSFLLDRYDYTPLLSAWSDQKQEFIRLVEFTKNRNDINKKKISSILSKKPKNHKFLTATANKYFDDLFTKVSLGWTGYGQTQQIFFDVTRLLRIFGHILLDCDPLWDTDRLAEEIHRYISALPERQTWCKHNHELEKMSKKWAVWVQKTKYKPYGRNSIEQVVYPSIASPEKISWNERKSLDARQRIRHAFDHLLNQDILPEGAAARAKALAKQGISFSTLYRHSDLWHPKHFTTFSQSLSEVRLHSNSTDETDKNPLKATAEKTLQSLATKESFNLSSQRMATSFAGLDSLLFGFGVSKGENQEAQKETSARETSSDLNRREVPQQPLTPHPKTPRSFSEPPMTNFNSEPSREQFDLGASEHEPVDPVWEAYREEEERELAQYRQELLAEKPIRQKAANSGLMNLESWYWSLVLEGEHDLEVFISFGKRNRSLQETCEDFVECSLKDTKDLQQDVERLGSLIPTAWGGDWDEFPAEPVEVVRSKRLAMALEGKYYLPKMEAWAKISFLLNEDFLEIVAAIQVRSGFLGWSKTQLRDYISQKFMGKTRGILTMFELTVLLYDLEIIHNQQQGKVISWADTEY